MNIHAIIALMGIAVTAIVLARRIWRRELELRDNERVERIIELIKGVKEG